ncbi:helix-turn-helix domain-containing protein [Alteromonas sp. ASW11-36]|uniref:Helix-turn-helix domain-containing protein n=1 Tax=Alteromonas arenosi TaxID=3055817 RepID=A0ABT7SZQ7_9ALTE|nr:helix-turn-helix domain-containing protein [Alteromonas sp. ASW11-36]MDM7861673.1 helix-turn-helix domain-containing protein [Alteromonas sp. ASW11-36]
MAELLEFITFILFGLWAALMVFAWVRFERLPHGKLLYIFAWCWPFMLFEDLLRLTGNIPWLTPLVGAFYFVPVLLMVGIVLMVYPRLMAKPLRWRSAMWAGVGIIVVCQIPILILSNSDKLLLLTQQPNGQPLANLPIYLAYWLSGLFILAMGVKLVEVMQVYQRTLSEQVVDVSYYQVPAIVGLTATLVGIGFAAIILTTIVAFDFIQFGYWQTTIHFSYAAVFLLVLILLLEKRRYSPMPFDLERLDSRQGDERILREVLARAEKTMIDRKAYKVIGLRIKQLADAAEVDPTNLAVASHRLLNRNFRAFVYHYRLEYAKKVLMRSDTKVSSVARRLGFHSEKFLSDMFVKYIEVMGVKNSSEFDDPLDGPLDNPFTDPTPNIRAPDTAAKE